MIDILQLRLKFHVRSAELMQQVLLGPGISFKNHCLLMLLLIYYCRVCLLTGLTQFQGFFLRSLARRLHPFLL
jgi:hypothetical protein